MEKSIKYKIYQILVIPSFFSQGINQQLNLLKNVKLVISFYLGVLISLVNYKDFLQVLNMIM